MILFIKQYLKALKGLAQIPQFVSRLIDNGIIESLKIVSDNYKSDPEIIKKTLETLLKISCNKLK
jgi:hypothetical protein